MSRRQGGYYWRHVRCDGCERECRYADFRCDPPVPSFAEIYQSMKDNPRYPFHRRGTVLGYMHGWKLSLWEQHCTECIESISNPRPEPIPIHGEGPDPDEDCPF